MKKEANIAKKGKKYGSDYYEKEPNAAVSYGGYKNLKPILRKDSLFNFFKSPVFVISLVFFLVLTGIYFLAPGITGFFTAREGLIAYEKDVSWAMDSDKEYSFSIDEYPSFFNLRTFRLSGSYTGNGTVKAYLETSNGTRFLIFDNGTIAEEELSGVTSYFVGGEQDVPEEAEPDYEIGDIEEEEETEEGPEDDSEEKQETEDDDKLEGEIAEEQEDEQGAEDIVEEENETEEETIEEDSDITAENEGNITEEANISKESATKEVNLTEEVNITEPNSIQENITEEININKENLTQGNITEETNLTKNITKSVELNITNATEINNTNISEVNITANISKINATDNLTYNISGFNTTNISEINATGNFTSNMTGNLTQNISQLNITNTTGANISEVNVTENISLDNFSEKNITEEINITEEANITEEINLTEEIVPLSIYKNVKIMDVEFHHEWKNNWGIITELVLAVENTENKSVDIKYLVLDVEGYDEPYILEIPVTKVIESGEKKDIVIHSHFSYAEDKKRRVRIRIKDKETLIMNSKTVVFDPKKAVQIKEHGFEAICSETCLLPPGLNNTEYKVVFEVSSGLLEINKIDYVLHNLSKEFNASVLEEFYKKVKEDPEYDAVIDSVDHDNETDTLKVRFHHDSVNAQPIFVKGDVEYSLNQGAAAAGENVTLTVYNWNNRRFRILVGKHTEAFEFGEARSIRLRNNIKNAARDRVQSRIELVDSFTNETVLSTDSEETVIDEGEYNIRIAPENMTVKNIEIKDIGVYDDVEQLIDVDDVPKEKEGNYTEVYAIDPTKFNFTNATVTVTAKGTKLYKCKDWNFTEQECYGEWELFKENLVPGEEYTFELTPQDPGFGEIVSSCAAEDDETVPGTFADSCDAADGSYLESDDGTTETHVSTVNNFYAGVRIESVNSSVTDCDSITKVEICYEWWYSGSKGVKNCDVSVDADNGASYTAATTTCPGETANPGVICTDVTSSESWNCSHFFGASGTRALAKSELTQQPAKPSDHTGYWDVLYFNVSYTVASCVENLTNTSWSEWENIGCVADQMNQSREKTEYDANNCNETSNTTYYEYQLVGPDYQNTSWTEWYNITECQPEDYYTQERNLTQYDTYGCAANQTFTEQQNLSCDYCTPSLANTSWTDWYNISVCYVNDTIKQERNRTEYDENYCGEVENSTHYEYQTVFCLNPPASVDNLDNQSAGTTWVYWNWTNPGDTDFNESIIYIDGANVLNTSNNFYNATGLDMDTEYVITIHTKDSLGNVNNTDVNDTASTLADISVPNITLNSPLNNRIETVSPGNVTFTCSAEDDNELANISLYLTESLDENLELNQTASVSGTENQSSFSVYLQEGNYTWNCLVYDAAGNENWGENRSLTSQSYNPINITYGTPVIDADLEEWSSADYIKLTGTDNNATIYVMWDNNYLYAAADIADTELWGDSAAAGERDGSPHNDDAFEMFIDRHNTKNSNPMTENQTQFMWSVNNHSWEGKGYGYEWAYNTSWNSSMTWAVSYTGTLNNNADTDTGYILETAIPWSDLGISPSGGDVIGISFAFDDDDNGTGREGQEFWIGGDYNDPDTWGNGYLDSGDIIGINITSISITPDDDGITEGVQINPIEESNVSVNLIANLTHTSAVDVCNIRIWNGSGSYAAPTLDIVTGEIAELAGVAICNATWTMEYWRNPGDWNINVDVNLTNGESDNENSSYYYNVLTAHSISTPYINFTGNPGDTINSSNAFPLVIQNTGNKPINISVKGEDFIGISDSSVNITASGASYSDTADGIYISLSTDFVQIIALNNLAPKLTDELFFRGTIPEGTRSQSYNNTISIKSS